MTATEPLTDQQRLLVQSAAELAALADCLAAECDEEDADPTDLRMLLVQSLRRIGRKLWEAA